MLELIKPVEPGRSGYRGQLHRVLASLAARLAELKAPETTLRSKLVGRCRPRWPWPSCNAAARRCAMPAISSGPATRAPTWSTRTGLMQLTTDDLRSGGDAMRNLTDDSVMSNCILGRHRVPHQPPPGRALGAVPAAGATDGCFAYVHSPMHFEHLLLATLGAPRTPARGGGRWRRR